jgi:ABC-type antimicrobial peptide transport system permease subunit
MTDIPTTVSIAIRRLNLPRLSFPRLKIGATLNAMFDVMGDALKLAYVAPYTSLHRQPQIVPDDDLEGRDPTW